MGVTTDAYLCCGVEIGDVEDLEDPIPWHEDEDDDHDIECWWRRTRGYVPPFEIYDENGRLPGVTDETVSKYFAHRDAWDEANPLPVAEVDACHADYPHLVLAIPSTVVMASRGHPAAVDPASLKARPSEMDAFASFVGEFFPQFAGKPLCWFLCSYSDF